MRQTPEEMEAAFAAFAAQHNAALAAPLAREQREAGRLVGILRARYAEPGPWRYMGEESPGNPWLYGLGYFETQAKGWPCDLKAVSDLCVCLRACQAATTVDVALFEGKRLIALLREAQTQCDEVPEPLELSRLNRPAEFTVLRELAALCGTPEARAGMKEIEMAAELSTKSARAALKSLAEAGLVERMGKDGGTVYRPTQRGHRCAEWSVLHP